MTDRSPPSAPEELNAAFNSATLQASVSWADSDDPPLSDGSDGSQVDRYSFRYRASGAAWSPWAETTSAFAAVPVAPGQQLDLEVRGIDEVGNVSSTAAASALLVADSPGAAEFSVLGQADSISATGTQLRQATTIFKTLRCVIGTGDEEARTVARYAGEDNIAVVVQTSGYCEKRPQVTPQAEAAAEIAFRSHSLKITACIAVRRADNVRGAYGCKTYRKKRTSKTSPLQVSRLDLCRAGFNKYSIAVSASVTAKGSTPDSFSQRFGALEVSLVCNAAGAWRRVATRDSFATPSIFDTPS